MKITITNKNGEYKMGSEWYDDGFTPTTFELVGCDTSNAKITPEQALAITQAAQYSSPIRQYKDAAALVQYDHVIRTNGKEMESKFDGTDAVTGEAFQAGTKIIFFSGNRTAGKGAVIA